MWNRLPGWRSAKTSSARSSGSWRCGAYVRYAERPGAGRYLLVLLAFCLGLMSKPMIVTLPLVMLLLDVGPLRRWPLRLWEKLPFFALSIGAAVQSGAGAAEAVQVPLGMRVENALVSYIVYIAKMFWPTGLAVFNPYPQDLPVWQVAIAVLVLAGLSAWRYRTFPPACPRRYPSWKPPYAFRPIRSCAKPSAA